MGQTMRECPVDGERCVHWRGEEMLRGYTPCKERCGLETLRGNPTALAWVRDVAAERPDGVAAEIVRRLKSAQWGGA